jgi:hypothetical protein
MEEIWRILEEKMNPIWGLLVAKYQILKLP